MERLEGLSGGKCNYFTIEGRRGLRAGYRRSSWSSSKVCRDARKECPRPQSDVFSCRRKRKP